MTQNKKVLEFYATAADYYFIVLVKFEQLLNYYSIL